MIAPDNKDMSRVGKTQQGSKILAEKTQPEKQASKGVPAERIAANPMHVGKNRQKTEENNRRISGNQNIPHICRLKQDQQGRQTRSFLTLTVDFSFRSEQPPRAPGQQKGQQDFR